MDKPTFEFPLNTFAPVLTWLRLACKNGGIPPKYWGKRILT